MPAYNDDLAQLADMPLDPMAAMMDNSGMMMELWREVARVGGGELASGPVPAGSTAEVTGQVGRRLRRAGNGLSGGITASPQATMRYSHSVRRALSVAMRTNRPNMLRLMRMAAFRAYQVAQAPHSLDGYDDAAKKAALVAEMERRRRLYRERVAHAGQSPDSGNSDDFRLTSGEDRKRHMALGTMLIDRVFSGDVTALPMVTATAAPNQAQRLIARMLGRDPAPANAISLDTPRVDMALDRTMPPPAPAMTSAPNPMG